MKKFFIGIVSIVIIYGVINLVLVGSQKLLNHDNEVKLDTLETELEDIEFSIKNYEEELNGLEDELLNIEDKPNNVCSTE